MQEYQIYRIEMEGSQSCMLEVIVAGSKYLLLFLGPASLEKSIPLHFSMMMSSLIWFQDEMWNPSCIPPQIYTHAAECLNSEKESLNHQQWVPETQASAEDINSKLRWFI